MSRGLIKGLPLEIAAAYRDAHERGLPIKPYCGNGGWHCTIDSKRNRRKWVAPDGRAVDSIPKAIVISIELGMLPKDFLVHGPAKRQKVKRSVGRPRKQPKTDEDPSTSGAAPIQPNKEETQPACTAVDSVDTAVDSVATETSASAPVASLKKNVIQMQEPRQEPVVTSQGKTDDVMNPEQSLDLKSHKMAPPLTIHWDPKSPDGSKVGWIVRIGQMDARITRYDPYTHKHKVVFSSNGRSTWIWLRNLQHNVQLATRLVWALIKGYAFWPAMVVERPGQDRAGFVNVIFFGTQDYATLRETSETIRPFSPSNMDPLVAKHRKKRNQNAYNAACDEYAMIRKTRNQFAWSLAERAFEFANAAASKSRSSLVGRKIQLHRSDVNYPYGESLTAIVRAYSSLQKKWLLAYTMSEKTKIKYEASWINVNGKDCHSLKPFKSYGHTKEDLIPYLVGYEYETPSVGCNTTEDAELVALLTDRCRGCVEFWHKDDARASCSTCDAEYHLGCFDPPLTLEGLKKLAKEGTDLVCPKCKPCRGCYQKDIVFGCHGQPTPPTLALDKSELLDLCYSCQVSYEGGRYCPICAHAWDSEKLDKIGAQIDLIKKDNRKKSSISSTGKVADTVFPLMTGSFRGDDAWPPGVKVDPTYFYPETSVWGYGENEMLICDGCNKWVHAACAGIKSAEEYDEISDGNHAIYSKDYLCRVCCRKRCVAMIEALEAQDTSMLFSVPVTNKVAPNYRDVIKSPMDLSTMLEKATTDDYENYAWVRELFELMVLNALTFNRYYTPLWNEAKRYYTTCIKHVFKTLGIAAPRGKYAEDIEANFEAAAKARQREAERVQVDETVEKKDLVAGSAGVIIKLPTLRDNPPDQASCLPFAEVTLKLTDAFYCSWMDCCYTCGASGAMDCMIFCVDCAEAFHTFCVNAPIHSMDEHAVAGWRCPNCKICEISGDVPQDETRMLFCEMCDRAFSLDLLDPPLSSAPLGLWVCGQCVDCKECKNTSEPGGASLKHWSRDPEKCFRCGGCDGLVEDYKCLVCSKLLRAVDDGTATCSKCQGAVHGSCDSRAMQAVAAALKTLSRGETANVSTVSNNISL
jgi:hypothetical protein